MQRDTPVNGAPHETLRRVECNANGCRATSTCLTVAQRQPVTLAPIATRDHATIAPWFQDNDVERWAGGSALLDTWLAPGAPCSDAFVARSDSEPVAVIGAERTVGETVIALVVNPARRDEGIGTSTLETLAGLPQYRASRLTCEIASDNVAARLAAGHAGFSEGEPDNDGYITFARVPGEADR